MVAIVSWNIQYGQGVDGVCDLGRIVAAVRDMGDCDVLCVQEVAVNFAEMGGGAAVDQIAQLCALMPGYQAVFAPGVDRAGPDGARRRFGNLILSRLPVLDAAAHILPRPARPGVQHMARSAADAVVETPQGALRIVTTHLEFHSRTQRLAQVKRLRGLYAEAASNGRQAPSPGPGPYAAVPAAIGTVICGDFNFDPAEECYPAMQARFADETPPLCDAWPARHPGRAHAPTCGIHDRRQWPQGPHARDFIFVSAELVPMIEDIEVEVETAASDHQPVRIVLGR